MKSESIILSIVAILGGVIVAGVAFYIFQVTKMLPASKTKTVTLATPTPKPASSNIFLSLDQPKDESVTSNKTITVSGKTIPDAIVVISTETEDQVIKPTNVGSFSATTVILDSTNKIEITAIAPNGEQTTIVRNVSYSAESF